jgi:tripartite-type tricarboxylate transporter receptor subunit TctC
MRSFLTAAAMAATLAAPGARADAVADFYKGKTVTVMIGVSVGGEYDLLARLVARHVGRHIPGNPNVVPQNMTGAGGLVMANWLYNLAPRDGTTMGVIQNGFPSQQAVGLPGVQFDANRYAWIGSIAPTVETLAFWKAAGVGSVEDLRRREVIVGSVGKSNITYTFPMMMNEFAGTKLRIVTGYPGGNDINLAMERGEVDGRCGWSWTSLKSQKNWLPQINLLVQFNLEKNADLPNVPVALERAASDEQRQVLRLLIAGQYVGRPFFTSPDIPADRKAALRAAFDATMKDPQFLADAAKLDLEISPVGGAAIDAFLAELYRTPKDVVSKAVAAIQK